MNCIRQQVKTFHIAGLLALLILAAGAAVPAQGQTPTTIYTFAPPAAGDPANPNNWSGAQGRNGSYYFSTCTPTTSYSYLLAITTSGTLNTVYVPIACTFGVTLGTDGNFYGAVNDTEGGGNTDGEIYKVTPAGVATILHTFTGGTDGADPSSPPIEATNGTFYGVTTNPRADSTAYSVTSGGTFTTLHTFTGSDGQCLEGQLVQGSDGNFYGLTECGGTDNLGVIFKMTATGSVTVLHNFAGTDGSTGAYPLIQAKDGNFYGTTLYGGTNGAGVLFKITSSGTYTALYNFPYTGTNQYTTEFPYSGVIQATNGLLYGTTGNVGGPWAWGTIYSYNTTTDTFTTLYSFTGGADGGQPVGQLLQHTNGLLYGTTYAAGDTSGCATTEWDGEFIVVPGCGTVFSFNIGAAAFAILQSTSGKEGAKISMFGQGFSSSSVVKFGGTKATTVTLSGTTYLTATVPSDALTGSVTVTTGSTTLTSTKTFNVTPTMTSFSPSSGPVGQLVTINGTGLMQATKVTFNGKSASFTVVSDIEVTATVPTGATTGKIKVTTKGGSVTSSTNFTVN
jgi:uncharacterized repeat protein (TIGR03803 family)